MCVRTMMKHWSREGIVLVLLSFGLILLASASSAQEIDIRNEAPFNSEKLGLEPVTAVRARPGDLLQPKGVTEPEYYIVMLADPPLAAYSGGIAGLTPTSPGATGHAKIETGSVAGGAYVRYLADRQLALLASIRRIIAADVEVAHQYRYALNGIAVKLTPEQAAAVAALPDVVRVERSFDRYLQTDVGPRWIGADAVWTGAATGGLPGAQGEGVIIGVIDSGINMDHPSFADVGGDGYDHESPLGAGVYVGWCNPAHPQYDPMLVCNDKLIGVYSYPGSGNNPEDDVGHGSHAASAAAGNVILNAELFAPTTSITADISGVAPHANIIAYDACNNRCALVDLVAAIDQATADGVDVINYSVGGGSDSPWINADTLAFLNAFNAGIIPVTSAGNDGPGAAALGSPAEAPWMLTVAASTHNRVLRNRLTNLIGDAAALPDVVGAGLTARLRTCADRLCR